MSENWFSEEAVLSLAKKSYEKGGASFPITKERCALLVIDMQDEFAKPHWSPYWVPDASKQVPKIKQLIEFFRENTLPVIYTVFSDTHHYLDRPRSGRFMPNRYPDLNIDQSVYFVKGRVIEELQPEEDEIIIHKPSYGAFYDTPLETILKNINVDTVVICGTLTNYCCSTTARQAYERGFKVIFGSDVNATDHPGFQEPELMTLKRGFAKVITAAEIIELLKSN